MPPSKEADRTVAVEQFRLDSERPLLSGESEGEGPDVVLCHGLSATRTYVTHGSHALPRAGYRVHIFDARGHGKSGPAPKDQGYGYRFQVADLDRVIRARCRPGRVVVGGHSMGCHTAAAWALENPDRVEALVLIGPVFGNPDGESPEDRWDERAAALLSEGPQGFAKEVSRGIVDEEICQTVARLAEERAGLHEEPAAVAAALREVPRSKPFDGLSSLETISAPCLIVGSRDEADPAHPLATAEGWAEAIPDSTLMVEDEGESPLAWQGGRLSRVMAEFLDGHGIKGIAQA